MGAVQLQGYVVTRVNSVPAFVAEPHMPAERELRAWILLYYSERADEKAEKYWRAAGKQMAETFRKDVKTGGEIKVLATELTNGKQSVAEKADALSIYCQTKIGNVNYNAEGMTSEDRDRYHKKLFKPEYNANDTLKNKLGTRGDIVTLFYSLAQAAGLNPAYVRASSLADVLFRVDFFDTFMVRHHMVAIPDGANFRYYDPGLPYLPPAMPGWEQQGQAAVQVDGKESKLVNIPVTAPELSVTRRSAKLKLSAEGTLSGALRLEYTGHAAVTEKLQLEDQSAGSREEAKKKEFEGQYPGAQVTNLKIENANSPQGMLAITFEMTMENYASRTGKRMFFQPSVFDFGDLPLFSAPKRTHPVLFNHPFSEQDQISIELPQGYALESAAVPGALKLGEVGDYSMTATVTHDNPTLKLTRNFVWGRKGGIWFEPGSYEAVKAGWDQIHKMNTTNLTLRAQ